jgi:methionyl-tRNA formyltransferase
VERGGINNANVIRSLIKHNIEGVAVFGCGIIKPEIFKQCSAAIFVNAHQGISPYYRGSGTNFWPFVNNEPGLVGVTMHLIDSGIDTGEIICHGVPAMEPDDGIHDVGCKVIETSGELFCEIFRLIGKMNRIETFSQSSKGKLYLRKDFNANAVIKANENIKNGIIKNYLDGELPLTGKQIIKLI